MSKTVLLTSVCRPMGPQYGDAPSVGYELLYRQVTRAQGIFSPRTVNVYFGLDYIAENLDAPTVVLQYPSKRELIKELKKGYDYVGVSFIMALMHKMKETVALIRKYAPNSKIVLGGYGTVLKDEVLKPYGDFICREEGVAFMRRLLGEPEIPMPYKHPLIVSWLKVFGWKVSGTGKIFAGLGCPNGCDFCCTSHFFSRKHIKLLPTGRDIYNVVERYHDLDPSLVFLIIDEDFLLNKKRAMEFRECVLAGGKRLSIFAFSSIKAISQYKVEEILEMGIDGFLDRLRRHAVGLRQAAGPAGGRNPHRIPRARHHGAGLDDCRVRLSDAGNRRAGTGRADEAQAVAGAIFDLRAGAGHAVPRTRHQGKPVAGRLHQRQGFVLPARGRVPHDDEASDAVAGADRGHADAGVSSRIFSGLARAFIACWKRGSSATSNSRIRQIRFCGRRRNTSRRNCVTRIRCFSQAGCSVRTQPFGNGSAIWSERIHAELGTPPLKQQFKSVMAVGAALWTGVTLKLDLFQHPKLQRTTYRLPEKSWSAFEIWEEFQKKHPIPNFSIQVELQHAKKQVWMRLEGALSAKDAEGLGQRIRDSLARSKNRLVLDLNKLHWHKTDDLRPLCEKLSAYRSRIRVVLPKLSAAHPELLLIASMFHHY